MIVDASLKGCQLSKREIRREKDSISEEKDGILKAEIPFMIK